MLFPKSLTAACDEHSVSEVHADSGTETLGHRLRDHVIILYPKFPPLFFVHCTGGYKQLCCADKLNEKTPDLLDPFLRGGSVFSSTILWSLSACSAESSKSAAAAKVFDMFLGCSALLKAQKLTD